MPQTEAQTSATTRQGLEIGGVIRQRINDAILDETIGASAKLDRILQELDAISVMSPRERHLIQSHLFHPDWAPHQKVNRVGGVLDSMAARL